MAAPLLAEPAADSPHTWWWDHATATPPRLSDLGTLTRSLDPVIAADFVGAQAAREAAAAELLLAAMTRTVARVLGAGDLVVECDGGATGTRQVTVRCDPRPELTGHELLGAARRAAVADVRLPVGVRLGYGRAVADSTVTVPWRLGLQVHEDDAETVLDWRYDTRSFEPATVAELAEQFPLALIEVTSG